MSSDNKSILFDLVNFRNKYIDNYYETNTIIGDNVVVEGITTKKVEIIDDEGKVISTLGGESGFTTTEDGVRVGNDTNHVDIGKDGTITATGKLTVGDDANYVKIDTNSDDDEKKITSTIDIETTGKLKADSVHIGEGDSALVIGENEDNNKGNYPYAISKAIEIKEGLYVDGEGIKATKINTDYFHVNEYEITIGTTDNSNPPVIKMDGSNGSIEASSITIVSNEEQDKGTQYVQINKSGIEVDGVVSATSLTLPKYTESESEEESTPETVTATSISIGKEDEEDSTKISLATVGYINEKLGGSKGIAADTITVHEILPFTKSTTVTNNEIVIGQKEDKENNVTATTTTINGKLNTDVIVATAITGTDEDATEDITGKIIVGKTLTVSGNATIKDVNGVNIYGADIEASGSNPVSITNIGTYEEDDTKSNIYGGSLNASAIEVSGDVAVDTVKGVDINDSAITVTGKVEADSIGANGTTKSSITGGSIDAKNNTMEVSESIEVSTINGTEIKNAAISSTGTGTISATSIGTFTDTDNSKTQSSIIGGSIDATEKSMTVTGDIEVSSISGTEIDNAKITLNGESEGTDAQTITVGENGITDASISGGIIDVTNHTMTVNGDINVTSISGGEITNTGSIEANGKITAKDIEVTDNLIVKNVVVEQYTEVPTGIFTDKINIGEYKWFEAQNENVIEIGSHQITPEKVEIDDNTTEYRAYVPKSMLVDIIRNCSVSNPVYHDNDPITDVVNVDDVNKIKINDTVKNLTAAEKYNATIDKEGNITAKTLTVDSLNIDGIDMSELTVKKLTVKDGDNIMNVSKGTDGAKLTVNAETEINGATTITGTTIIRTAEEGGKSISVGEQKITMNGATDITGATTITGESVSVTGATTIKSAATGGNEVVVGTTGISVSGKTTITGESVSVTGATTIKSAEDGNIVSIGDNISLTGTTTIQHAENGNKVSVSSDGVNVIGATTIKSTEEDGNIISIDEEKITMTGATTIQYTEDGTSISVAEDKIIMKGATEIATSLIVGDENNKVELSIETVDDVSKSKITADILKVKTLELDDNLDVSGLTVKDDTSDIFSITKSTGENAKYSISANADTTITGATIIQSAATDGKSISVGSEKITITGPTEFTSSLTSTEGSILIGSEDDTVSGVKITTTGIETDGTIKADALDVKTLSLSDNLEVSGLTVSKGDKVMLQVIENDNADKTTSITAEADEITVKSDILFGSEEEGELNGVKITSDGIMSSRQILMGDYNKTNVNISNEVINLTQKDDENDVTSVSISNSQISITDRTIENKESTTTITGSDITTDNITVNNKITIKQEQSEEQEESTTIITGSSITTKDITTTGITTDDATVNSYSVKDFMNNYAIRELIYMKECSVNDVTGTPSTLELNNGSSTENENIKQLYQADKITISGTTITTTTRMLQDNSESPSSVTFNTTFNNVIGFTKYRNYYVVVDKVGEGSTATINIGFSCSGKTWNKFNPLFIRYTDENNEEKSLKAEIENQASSITSVTFGTLTTTNNRRYFVITLTDSLKLYFPIFTQDEMNMRY